MISAYHAKYYAHELTRRHAADGVDRLSQSLFDASVDLNCWRRFKIEPPCRLNFEPGLQASLRGPAVDKCSA